MAVESGVAGFLNLGGTPQSSTGPDLLRIIQAASQIKAQKQESARQNLETQLTLMEKYGIPPDEKVFQKTLQDAGMSPEALQTLGGVPAGGPKPQQVTQLGKTLQTQGGTTAPAGTDAIPAGTGTVEKGVAAANKSPFQMMVERAQQRVADTAATASQQEILNQHIMQVKERALGGDPTAVGQLMNVGGIPFNMQQSEWEGMSPEQRATTVSIAAGAESPAVKEQRLSNQAQQLWTSGRFSSLAEARAFAEGKPGVPIKPDLNRMVDEAKFTNEMVQLGLSGDQAAEVGKKMANGVSLSDALPQGVTPLVQQQLGLQRRQVEAQETSAQASLTSASAEVARVKLEEARVNKEAERAATEMMFKLKEQDDKDFNSRFDNMVEMVRNKVKVPDELQQNMINELASRSGMLPTEVESAWNYLGYKKFNYPAVNSARDKALVNAGAGGSQKLNTQSTPSATAPASGGVPPLSNGLNLGTINPNALDTMTNYREQYKKQHGVYPEQEQ
jgi:hypothetical protein